MAKLIRFYVEAIESRSLLEWENQLARYFGGFTKLSGKGAYTFNSGILTFESSYIFEVIALNPDEFTDTEAEYLAESLRQRLDQESVLLTIQDINARLV